ncbi:tetratricopeptide repeat protein 1 isoform X1 [Chaetodon trifascialis]|uniref:tetratricopeptide repeat protein 1 isoform X1 n=1 Tax=Chaetodon trifascialis TaxID=109706 RepID=UPI00399559AE
MSSRAAGKPRQQKKEEEEEEEDFYDCKETLEPPDQREVREEEVAQQDEGSSQDFNFKADRLTERGGVTDRERKRQEEVQHCRLQEEVLEDKLQEEVLEDKLQEEVLEDKMQEEVLEDRLQEEVLEDKLQEEVLEDKLQEEVLEDKLQEEVLEDKMQEEVLEDKLQEEVLEDKMQEEVLEDRLQGEVLEDKLQEEVLEDKLQEEVLEDKLQEDSDLEFKEENSPEVEFDDDYLKEVEKELTEEEKETRRQQSLTLKEKGNSHFKAGDWLEAERSYKEALVLCPVCFSRERAVLFSNRAAARLHLDLKEQAISDCTRAIELNPDYVRALLRRAELYEQTEKLDEALEDYKKVLDRDPNQAIARQACMRLPQQIQERNEKLKEEMISKLKDLGNLVLRPFGLSTNNFQVNQDANTGSYSINFVQSPNNNR